MLPGAVPNSFFTTLARVTMSPNAAASITIHFAGQTPAQAPFENLDLAFLSAGWQASGEPLTVEDGMHLIDVARVLTRVYDDLCKPHEYPGVFVYEIAEELGKHLGVNQEYDLASTERIAREWVIAQMNDTRERRVL
jgi:hypothetical protein